jgi:protein subunit release factor B
LIADGLILCSINYQPSTINHHPSMATTREDKLLERMAALGIRGEDIVESFTRSSGPGGQNVNKTSSAVVLVHRPTGLQVRCEQERSQAQNRLLAREWLLAKIEGRIRALREKEQAQREKLRRQTRKRSRGAKERILRDKARHSTKKRLRQGARDD